MRFFGVGKLTIEGAEKPPPYRDVSREEWLHVHSVLSKRRIAYDTLMWQMPALSLAGQAFLMTIALRQETNAGGRYFAAGLSILISFVAAQAMDKARACEVTDSRWLEKIEDDLGLALNGIAPHSEPAERARAVKKNAFENRPWLAIRSHVLWKLVLVLFGLAALGVILLTALDPELLANSGLTCTTIP